jgi:hypothetical protein
MIKQVFKFHLIKRLFKIISFVSKNIPFIRIVKNNSGNNSNNIKRAWSGKYKRLSINGPCGFHRYKSTDFPIIIYFTEIQIINLN